MFPRQPSPLIFPAGVTPGFDPLHVAANRTRFSAVAAAGNFVNVAPSFTSQITGTLVGSPTFGIDGFIGPAFAPAVGGYTKFPTANQPGGLPVTLAAIVYSPGGLNNGIFATSLGGSNGEILHAFGGQVGLDIDGFQAANAFILGSGYYFIIASYDGSSSVNFLLRNLVTGAIQTNTIALTHVPAGGGTGYEIGHEFEFGTDWPGKIAAVMHSNNFLSLPALRVWATDPWLFWYPQGDDAIVGASSGTATGVLSSAGVGAAAWIGAAQDAAVLSSAGTGAASWVSSAIDAAVLSAAGTGAAAWVGNSVAGGGALSATGTGAANWVTSAVSAAVLNAAGQGAFNGASPVATPATTAMAGSGSARFIGAQSGGATGFEYPPGYGRYGSGRATKPWLHDDGFVDEPDL